MVLLKSYFEYIIKNREILSDKSPVQIHVYKIQGRITFKIKTRYYFDVLTLEAIKLLGSTERRITKGKNGENVPRLEIIEVVLVHCNIANNQYQYD